MATCQVCFRHCEIKEGELGFCRARIAREGKVETYHYGKISSLALDPIEKKPLARFYPGSTILSVGSFGCNLRCPFCQNHEISWSKEAEEYAKGADILSPEELVDIALQTKDRGNIGIAFTYNEPLTGYEYVYDCSKLAGEHGLKTVLVTNGTANLPILREVAPYIDAMNIDLKGFRDAYYRDVLGGNRKQVMEFIEEAVKYSHVELTTLLVTGENDSVEEMEELSSWVGRLKNPDKESVPLHITRFFPKFHMTDREATDVKRLYELVDVARQNVEYVYPGNC